MDNVLEKDLEVHFRNQCKRLGLLTLKLNVQQNRGYPDRIVMHKGRVHFSELKTLTGKQTPLQQLVASKLIVAGFPVPILRTKAEITAYLEAICLTT